MTSDHKNKYFITGSGFFISNELERLKKNYEDYDDFTGYGDEFDRDEFYSFINTGSLFSEGKYAIVSGFDTIKDPKDVLANSANSLECEIIFTSEKKDILKKLKKPLDEHGYKVISEKKPDRRSQIDLVRRMFIEKDLQINGRFAEEVYEIFNGEMTSIADEIEKLSLFFHYKKPKDEVEIMEQIAAEKQENIFKFIDDFSARRKGSCLLIYNSFVKHMENFNMLFFLLFKRVKNLYFMKTSPEKVKEVMWVMEKIRSNANKWSQKELQDLIAEFAECDYLIKTGQLRIENSILRLINLI